MATLGLAPQDFADAESTSICPLLTPSPSEIKLLSTSPDFLPANLDEESASTCPLLGISANEIKPIRGVGNNPDDDNGDDDDDDDDDDETTLFSHPLQISASGYNSNTNTKNCDQDGNMSKDNLNLSTSSNSLATLKLQTNPSCVQLLNHYHQTTEKKINEINLCMSAAGHQQDICTNSRKLMPIPSADSYGFIDWNWPLIRMSCFWIVLSITIACFCIAIGMVATVPSKCFPSHKWHQGGVFYEIFPASFQDTTHDGIGDLRGIAQRIKYFQTLGITAIHLNSIFPAKSYPEEYEDIENLTSIDKHLGGFDDLIYLLNTLHKSNISLVLDLPLFPLLTTLGQRKIPTKSSDIADKISNTVHNHRSHRDVNETESSHVFHLQNEAVLAPYIDGGIAGLKKADSEHLKSTSKTITDDAIQFWFQIGVDGIYIKGLERYINHPHFVSELESWKRIKEQHSDKILMADYSLFTLTENDPTVQNQILSTFDLLDVYLPIAQNTTFETVQTVLKSYTKFQKTSPWIHWNIGNVDADRLSTNLSTTLGAICFQFLLPGTVSIFYGDEISLSAIEDLHHEHIDTRHRHHLSPMVWDKNNRFTSSSLMPWVPYGTSTTSDSYLSIIQNMTLLRKTIPAVYMDSIRKDNEVIINTNLRHHKGLLLLERSYPRRNSYLAIYNLSPKNTHFDLSSIYYSGEIIVRSNDDRDISADDRLVFNEVYIPVGDCFIVKLDK